ncbi:MAG: TraB/GumN family protein [Candidatus Methanospirareceae archaeon]
MHNLILVGTGHILEKSIREVERVIEREKPDIVAVELCESRYRALKGDIGEISIREALSSENVFLLLIHWLLAYVQRKMGAELGVEPGAEMLAAIKKAEEEGCEVVLIDRDIGVTMRRFWEKMKFFEKIKMLFSLFFAIANISIGWRKGKGEKIDIERITDDDVVSELLKELREFSPSAATVLLDERDAYIAARLHDMMEKFPEKKIVVVVGAGHISGIKKYLEHPELIPPKEELYSLPKKYTNIKKILSFGFISAVLLSISLLLLLKIPYNLLLTALLYWIVINGVLSASGVIIAGGHPLSALTAFGVAWLTSLNPFIAAGWFAGLIEAYIRKPMVEDAKKLLKITSFRELMHNRLFRVIFVAAMANIGSFIGTFIGAYVVFHVVGINLESVWGKIRMLSPLL